MEVRLARFASALASRRLATPQLAAREAGLDPGLAEVYAAAAASAGLAAPRTPRSPGACGACSRCPLRLICPAPSTSRRGA